MSDLFCVDSLKNKWKDTGAKRPHLHENYDLEVSRSTPVFLHGVKLKLSYLSVVEFLSGTARVELERVPRRNYFLTVWLIKECHHFKVVQFSNITYKENKNLCFLIHTHIHTYHISTMKSEVHFKKCLRIN